MTEGLLQADRLVLRYKGMAGPALNDVSFSVGSGQAVGLVGESGSGKSSLARCLLGIETYQTGGVLFRGADIRSLDRAGCHQFRRKVQMVFQDPLNSLNPRRRIGDMLGEVLRVHRLAPSGEVAERVAAMLETVGLGMDITERFPHELSGGQRQRAGIARALLLEPEVIIADEPVSALDVSVQAQILNLLAGLVSGKGISLVLIAHDLAVVRYVCERIAVMNQGVIVEEGPAGDVIDTPRHDYTRRLLASVPDIDRLLEKAAHG